MMHLYFFFFQNSNNFIFLRRNVSVMVINTFLLIKRILETSFTNFSCLITSFLNKYILKKHSLTRYMFFKKFSSILNISLNKKKCE
jgi:hypothetical protein